MAGDPDVGASDEPAASAECVPLHPRHHRCGTPVDRLEHAVEAHRVLDVLLVGEVDRGALPLDVGAPAEGRSLSGQDDRARILDAGERLGQLGDQRCIEGVAALRSRECHPQHRTVPLHAQGAHRGRQLKV